MPAPAHSIFATVDTLMNIILAPFGSSGDVNPFVGIGARMRDRGHRVTVIASEHFAGLIEAEGLEFTAIGTDEEYQRWVDHPDMWDPRKSLPVLYGAILEAMPRVYERIAERYEPGSTVLVAPSFNIGARVAHDKLGIPLASVILNPLLLPSVHSPARSPLMPTFPRWMGRWGPKIAYRLVGLKYKQIIGERLDRFRRSLELPPVRDVRTWMRSPQRIIGLWPEWLYGRQPDWPPHAETTGFVHYDGVSTISGEKEGAWNVAGQDAPIVFTAGTAMSQGPAFFAAAAGACAISKRPGLLLTQRPEQLPESLPEGVEHVAYAPFGELLPKAAAIVHHGGIGTAARAVKAGIPQLMVPHAYDQFDNCQRFADLGLAAELTQEDLSAENLAAALDRLLGSSIIAEKCRSYAGMVRSKEGLERTCDLLEGLVGADSPNRGNADSSG